MSAFPTKRRQRNQPHWICSTTGRCLCSGADEQCDCKRISRHVVPEVGPSREAVRVDMCADCQAAMVCIDFSTGELLQPPKEVIAGDWR